MYVLELHAIKYSISSLKQNIKVVVSEEKKKAQNLNTNADKCANEFCWFTVLHIYKQFFPRK